MDELKPCPFCGSKAIHNSQETERINCANPGCYQSEEWRTYGQYIKLWNTRPLEDALRAQLDVAMKALEEIADTNSGLSMVADNALAEIAKLGGAK